MFIEVDLEPEIDEALERYFANGGDLVTYDEHTDLVSRVAELERIISNIDFFKADRNHSHA